MAGRREAVVKLKEEYVKAQEDAEERQIEVEERAQDTIRKSTTGGLIGGTDSERARIVSGLRDKIATLQNRMELSRKELKNTRAKSEKLQRGRAAMERQIDVLKEQLNSQEETLADQLDTIKDYQRKEKDFRRREIVSFLPPSYFFSFSLPYAKLTHHRPPPHLPSYTPKT